MRSTRRSRHAAGRAWVVVAALSLVPLSGAAQQSSARAIDAQQLMRDVETLSSDAMEGRRTGTPGALRAREYLVKRFKDSGITPIGTSYEHAFSFRGRADTEDRTGVNVLGVIYGRDRNRFIVVTAHYDHLGVRNGQIYNGANDNASGVAVLLAVATRIAADRPQHSVLFAALDAEESGLHGARALLRTPPIPRESMLLNVNLDMVARDDRNVLFASGTHHYPFLKTYLAGVAQPPVTLRFGHDAPGPGSKEDDWTRQSDHFAFHEAGIPFIYFGVEDEAQHHKATDDAETVTREFFIGAAETIAAAIRKLDAALDGIVKR